MQRGAALEWFFRCLKSPVAFLSGAQYFPAEFPSFPQNIAVAPTLPRGYELCEWFSKVTRGARRLEMRLCWWAQGEGCRSAAAAASLWLLGEALRRCAGVRKSKNRRRRWICTRVEERNLNDSCTILQGEGCRISMWKVKPPELQKWISESTSVL